MTVHDFEGGNINATNYLDYAAIMLPPFVFSNNSGNNVDVVFSSQTTSDFYPLVNKTLETYAVDSSIISATVLGDSSEFNGDIFVILRLHKQVHALCYGSIVSLLLNVLSLFIAFPSAHLCLLG